ncbi:MAG TPA: glycoside hydrolase family 38 C-terminal domain-containing protein [Gemmatimonadales bacterium]|jgi:hypothetical protein
MIFYSLLLAADTLTRALGALPAGVTDGYASTIRGQRFTYQSAHPTEHASLLVRSVDSTNAARWLTAPVAANAGAIRHVTFLAAMDVTDPGQTPVRFWVIVNNSHRIPVPQPATAADSWSASGADHVILHFRRLMTDRYGDVHGLFTLDIPAALAPAGAPVTIQVQGEDVGRQSWFIIYTVSMQPTITAHVEQMLARSPIGNQQTIRLDAWHPFDTATVVVSTSGVAPDTVQLAAGATTARVTVPAVSAPTAIALRVRGRDAMAEFAALPLAPVVQREVYLINHNHLDIGYTDLQPAVQAKHERSLDSALVYIDRSRSNPPDARFVWNAEGLWHVQDYLEHRPAADTARLLADVRHGDVALSALYANLMTGLSGSEELIHLLDYTRQLRRDQHVPITMAMSSDVPGYTWGMVPALASQGVRYLSSGPNESDRIGNTLTSWGDKPFWWVGPSGRDSLLVMFAGRGYSWVYNWPAGRLTTADANVMSGYMDDLAARHYPWDIVQIRVTIGGDNGVPDGQLANVVRDWNARYVSPHLVIATLPQMFRAMEQRHGAALPKIRGDLTGYWEDGAVSSLNEDIINRASAARLVEASTLAALRGVQLPIAARDSAWRDVLLWDEHTWGADRSISDPESPQTLGQWHIKQGFALSADSASRALLTTASAGASRGQAVDLWNTHAVAERGVVVLADALSHQGDRVRNASGHTLPSQRLHNGALALRADLEPLGATRLTVATGAATPPAGEPAHAGGDSLWNGHVVVHVDHATGAIASVRWRGRELVDQSRGGLGRYRYVQGTDTSKAADASGTRIEVVDNGPLVATLRVTSNAPGANSLVREVTLDAGSDAVQLVTHLDKKGVRTKEAVHIAFPLNVPGGTVRMEQGWAVVRPDVDQADGANRNLYPVQRWLDASNGTFGVTLLTPDLPLWELNGLTAEAFMQPDGREAWLTHALPGTELIAYAMNNYWHTNYKADQPGPVTFRVVIVPHGPFEAAAATHAAMEVSEPPVAMPATASATPRPRFMIDDTNIVVSSIATSRDGRATMVRLWNPGTRMVQVGLRGRNGAPLTISLSAPDERPRAVVSGRITVPALGAVTVRVSSSRP